MQFAVRGFLAFFFVWCLLVLFAGMRKGGDEESEPAEKHNRTLVHVIAVITGLVYATVKAFLPML